MASVVLVYGATHALVDAACVTIVLSLVWHHPLSAEQYLALVIAYNALAFAFQPLCGWVADRVDRPALVSATGILLTAASMPLAPVSPIAALACAGLGNGIFHVGGGAVALLSAPGRAALVGLFVAPGDLGLAFATAFEGQPPLASWPFLLLLALALLAVVRLKTPSIAGTPRSAAAAQRWPAWIGLLLLLAVALRSLVGFTTATPWRNDSAAMLGIACAAFGGKALGGIVADRWGWMRTMAAALSASAVLLALGAAHVALVTAGTFLFQMAMPVTLAALFLVLPRRPALAFGLTCLALSAGAALAFSRWGFLLVSPPATFSAILVATASVLLALRLQRAGAAGSPLGTASAA